MTDVLQYAIAHHQQGRLAEALDLYEQILAAAPHPLVQHFAGMAYYVLQDFEKAEGYLGLAAASENRCDFFFGHGNALAALKRYGEAYAAFQNAVALEPGNAALWFNLANSARFVDPDRAIMAYQQAFSIDATLTQALIPLAALLLETNNYASYAALLRHVYETPAVQNKFAELVLLGAPQGVFATAGGAVFLEAFASLPHDRATSDSDADRALAVIYWLAGNEAAAIARLTAVLTDDPDARKIIKLVENYLGMGERYSSDLILFDLLQTAYPGNRSALNKALLFALGTENMTKAIELLEATGISRLQGMVSNENVLENAATYLFEALQNDPDVAQSYVFLSRILEGHNKIPDALHVARAAQEIAPTDTETNLQLARMVHRIDLDEAEVELEKALRLNPESPELLNYLGNIKMRRGDMTAALEYYAQAREHIGEGEGEKYELQLLSTLYTNGISGQLAGDMHKAWGDALIAKQSSHRVRHAALVPKRRIKVGYLSADYRECSVAYFLMPLLENHDAKAVEVHLYNSLPQTDLTTKRFRQLGVWHDISALSDAEAVALIRENDIDILVDLLGQNQGLRPTIFARKAAPVQVTWLGYATTSGLATIDYRFTDAIADPPGMTESYHAEDLYRLPHFLCYQPPAKTPDVTELPALETGSVTFGCFNQSMKITDEVVAVWAAIMHRAPGSNMIVKAAEFGDPKTLAAFQEKFAAHNIAADRIRYYNRTHFKFDHLTVYSEIDLTLDPFPFNGTTTTFEALWMGVPMVTLAGTTHAARVGCSILEALGLLELIATSIEDYIDKAVALAGDLPRLCAYRAGMRRRLQTSPLMDEEGFARSVETAYADMWAKAVLKGVA